MSLETMNPDADGRKLALAHIDGIVNRAEFGMFYEERPGGRLVYDPANEKGRTYRRLGTE